MTRSEAKQKIISAMAGEQGQLIEETAEKILLALDGSLVLDSEIANFYGTARSVTAINLERQQKE